MTVAVISGSAVSQTVSWESSDTSIATVDSTTGKVTGINIGVVTVTAKRSLSGVYQTVSYTLYIMPLADGAYFIMNREHEGYLQLDDNASEDYSVANTIMEQHSFDAGNYQRWILKSLNNGYYKITSVQSGLALSVPTDGEADVNVALVQQVYTGSTRHQWKVYQSGNGSFCIKPRSADANGTNYVMCVGTGVTDGTNIEQRVYADDSSYKDEWYLYPTGSEVMLLGIIEDGLLHDHVSVFSSVMKNLHNAGYKNFNCIYENLISSSDCLTYMENAKVFLSRCHGGADEGSSWLALYNGDVESSLLSYHIYNFDTEIALVDFSNLELAAFVGCQTAYGGASAHNLVTASIKAGAEYAIGFEKTINCAGANTWALNFFELYSSGSSVEDAAEQAALLAAEKHYILEAAGELNIDSFCVVRGQ